MTALSAPIPGPLVIVALAGDAEQFSLENAPVVEQEQVEPAAVPGAQSGSPALREAIA